VGPRADLEAEARRKILCLACIFVSPSVLHTLPIFTCIKYSKVVQLLSLLCNFVSFLSRHISFVRVE
jgi:hypothetical protein